MKKIIISEVCGFCGGARRSLDLVRQTIKKEKNVVLFKELLHNKNVIKELEKEGVITKDHLLEISKEEIAVIRGHGEPLSTFEYLDNNEIKYIDCTCPNVKAIHNLVMQKNCEGYKIIIIGKHGASNGAKHPEVAGTEGWCEDPILIEVEEDIAKIDLSCQKYFLVVQTTFSRQNAEVIIEKIKKLMRKEHKCFEYKNTTCDAQKRINEASIELAKNVDVMIVMGGKNSSNTKELYNALESVVKCEFIENPEDVILLIKEGKFDKFETIGITAGASTMKEDVQKLKAILEEKFR